MPTTRQSSYRCTTAHICTLLIMQEKAWSSSKSKVPQGHTSLTTCLCDGTHRSRCPCSWLEPIAEPSLSMSKSRAWFSASWFSGVATSLQKYTQSLWGRLPRPLMNKTGPRFKGQWIGKVLQPALKHLKTSSSVGCILQTLPSPRHSAHANLGRRKVEDQLSAARQLGA